MIFNHLLHIVVGVVLSNLLTWSALGVLCATVISAGISAIDTFRIRRQIIAMTMANPGPVRSEQLQAIRESGTYKLAQLFVYKTIWYALVTLVAAQVARSWGA